MVKVLVLQSNIELARLAQEKTQALSFEILDDLRSAS